MGMEAEDHLERTDPHQWAAMEVGEDADDRLHRAADGEEGAGVEAEEDVGAEILGTDRAPTLGPGAGHPGGASHDHRIADHRQEHRRAVEEVVEEAATGKGYHHREEEVEVVAVAEEEEEGEGGEAQVTTRTTAHGPVVGAETADKMNVPSQLFWRESHMLKGMPTLDNWHSSDDRKLHLRSDCWRRL